MSLRRSKPLLIALLGLLVCPSVFAHGDSYSTLRVVVKADVLEVSLSLNFRDLSQWVPKQANPATTTASTQSADYPARVLATMQSVSANLFRVADDADQLIAPADLQISLPTAGVVQVSGKYATKKLETFTIQSLHLSQLPLGHHQVLTVEDARRGNGDSSDGIIIAQETLGAEQDSATIDLPDISRSTGRLKMVATTAPSTTATNPSGEKPRNTDPSSNSPSHLLTYILVAAGVVGAVFLYRLVNKERR